MHVFVARHEAVGAVTSELGGRRPGKALHVTIT